MMAEKARVFGDRKTEDRILASKDPGEAKDLGRQVDRLFLDQILRHEPDPAEIRDVPPDIVFLADATGHVIPGEFRRPALGRPLHRGN